MLGESEAGGSTGRLTELLAWLWAVADQVTESEVKEVMLWLMVLG